MTHAMESFRNNAFLQRISVILELLGVVHLQGTLVIHGLSSFSHALSVSFP